jgi:polyisoprenoid-binding protein YceI
METKSIEKKDLKTTLWELDPTHSEVQFRVKHLMITNITGSFKVLNARAEADENFRLVSVNFTIDPASVDTGNSQRDGHLKGPDFFDVEKFPEITFESNNYEISEAQIRGVLTIKGVPKHVDFDVEFNGKNKDPWGNEKAGFSINGKINRKDWNLNWNAPLETGGMLVSDEVRVSAELQFVRK